MSTAQAVARRQQRVEELCAAAVRALSDDPELHFRGQRLYRGRRRVPAQAPHLRPSLVDDDFVSFRGASDGMALRLTYSDDELHRRCCPEDPVERLLFEMLEQFRVEALAPKSMPGVVQNLRHRHVEWSLAFHHSGLTETSHGILLYTIAQICRSRVTGQPVVEETEELLEATRFGLVPKLGKDLAGLRQHRHDQAAYALHAATLARAVSDMLREAEEAESDGDDGAGRVPFSLFLDDGEEDTESAAPSSARGRRGSGDAEQDYRVFTTAYDREVGVATLVRPALLREYRERLDEKVRRQGVNIPRLARDLKALLAEPAPAGWEGEQEEGRLDARRLARLVTAPGERRLFRTERAELSAQCLVTFLIDCSGSMKQHAESTAVLVDVLARALDLAGVTSEVLGYTTGAWNGGRALRDWRRVGRPARPGRLNELCHLVFKDAGTPWRRARPAIAGLLKTDLYREGVDGEAVSWACQRMSGRDEQHRLLVVLSDGSPMDSATALTNDEQYLDDHLREVVLQAEQSSVRVYGLGVGLDLSPYYGRSHALDFASGLGNGAFREVLGMIAGQRQR